MPSKTSKVAEKNNEVKICWKIAEQEKIFKNTEKFDKYWEKVFNFLRDYTKMFCDGSYEAKGDETEGTWLKTLTLKQILQRLLIALAQVKTGNNSKNLLNEIIQIVYSLYQSKEITKKV